MSKVVVVNHMTLDGVMQGPGRADEDTRGGFERGGWASPNNDSVMAAEIGKEMASGGALLLGRRTYEDFFSFWPNQTDNPYTEVLNSTQKYVASTTLREPLPWTNSTLLSGDVLSAVDELKRQHEKNLVVLGSGRLIESLMEHGLIDEYTLMIHPLILGSGRRLFSDGSASSLELLKSVPTTTGVLIATFASADD